MGLRSGVWSCVRRSRGTAASTSSQPQAVMDSSADASVPRLLMACGLESWVPMFDSSADTPMSRLLVRGGWAPSWVSGLCGRSQGTAASTSSQPQAVMDSSADTSAPRLLAACGSGSWVPASDLSADISAARRLVAYGPGSALRRGAVLVWVCT